MIFLNLYFRPKHENNICNTLTPFIMMAGGVDRDITKTQSHVIIVSPDSLSSGWLSILFSHHP